MARVQTRTKPFSLVRARIPNFRQAGRPKVQGTTSELAKFQDGLGKEPESKHSTWKLSRWQDIEETPTIWSIKQGSIDYKCLFLTKHSHTPDLIESIPRLAGWPLQKRLQLRSRQCLPKANLHSHVREEMVDPYGSHGISLKQEKSFEAFKHVLSVDSSLLLVGP